MIIAGIEIPDRAGLELADKLWNAGHTSTAAHIISGHDRRAAELTLTIVEREEILDVLVDCPDTLCELRAILLQEHGKRSRDGL
jgi:hypothetical protein